MCGTWLGKPGRRILASFARQIILGDLLPLVERLAVAGAAADEVGCWDPDAYFSETVRIQI